MTNEETFKYELMLIFLPDLGEAGITTELDEIRALVKELKGDIYHEDVWGVRDFAYTIKKQDQGYYVVFNLNLLPESLKTLEETFNLNQKLLRYLLLKTPKEHEIKTLTEYLEEAELAKEEEEKKKKEEEDKKSKPAQPKRAPMNKEVEKVPEKVEAKKEEVKEEAPAKSEEEQKKISKKEEKEKLEEVDEKLKNIINDPDISL